jgi:NACHT domain
MAAEPKGSTQPWEVLLNVIAAIAAVIAVFQQGNGVRLGSGLVAGAFLVLAWFTTARRIRRRRIHLTWRERRIANSYFDNVVADILKELPELPGPANDALLASRISSQSAYVPVPYRAFSSGAYRTMTRRDLEERPTDPVDMLLRLLKDQQSAVVLGDPGSGKTLLAALTFARLADTYRSSRGRTLLPLFVRLNAVFARGSSPDSQTIVDYLPQSLNDLNVNTIERMLDSGRACILLDGLDELPTNHAPSQSTSQIPENLVSMLEKTTIVTCREAFHNLYIDADRVASHLGIEIELLPLTYEGQVVPFVRQYSATSGRPELADIILNTLSQNKALAETLSRPLMLRMTMDVLAQEMASDDKLITQRLLLTGSDYLNAQIYEEYVRSWIVRETRKDSRHHLQAHQKLELVETIAWQIFCNPARTDTGYGSFESLDLTIDEPTLVVTVSSWLKSRTDLSRQFSRGAVIAEIEERTFLIVSDRGETYRFAHKSFFEYMVARYVYNQLAQRTTDVTKLFTLLSMPFPDEIIDFIRELLHWSKTEFEISARRHNVEQSLLQVVRQGGQSDDSLMARQQAANLLPIVATPRTREYLRSIVVSEDHPFIRRAMAVGEALHHQNPEFLDTFVASLDGDERARSFHMGYNRIYYGDQPLSRTVFEDDGQPECTRFFRACIRHLRLDRYRYLRTMALATIKFMLADPARRALLLDQESEGLHWVREVCDQPDEQLGPVYAHEQAALAIAIDSAFASQTASKTSKGSDGNPDLDQGRLLKAPENAVDDEAAASDK